MAKKVRVETNSDLYMMKHPSNWPQWPFLPLVHRQRLREQSPRRTGLWVEVGMMSGKFAFYPDVNFWALASGEEELDPSKAESIIPEQLLAEGFEVD